MQMGNLPLARTRSEEYDAKKQKYHDLIQLSGDEFKRYVTNDAITVRMNTGKSDCRVCWCQPTVKHEYTGELVYGSKLEFQLPHSRVCVHANYCISRFAGSSGCKREQTAMKAALASKMNSKFDFEIKPLIDQFNAQKIEDEQIDAMTNACFKYNLDGRGGDLRFSTWALSNECGTNCDCDALCQSQQECEAQGNTCTSTHYENDQRCYCSVQTSLKTWAGDSKQLCGLCYEYNLDGRGGNLRYATWALSNGCGRDCDCTQICDDQPECQEPGNFCKSVHYESDQRCYCSVYTSTATWSGNSKKACTIV